MAPWIEELLDGKRTPTQEETVWMLKYLYRFFNAQDEYELRRQQKEVNETLGVK
jgi:hypothetical protein